MLEALKHRLITMAIDFSDGPLAPWVNGEWRAAMFDPLRDLIGEPLLGAFIGGGAIAAFYFGGDGSLAAPSILTILFAAFLLPVLPGTLQGIAYGIAFIGFMSGVVAVVRTYATEVP